MRYHDLHWAQPGRHRLRHADVRPQYDCVDQRSRGADSHRCAWKLGYNGRRRSCGRDHRGGLRRCFCERYTAERGGQWWGLDRRLTSRQHLLSLRWRACEQCPRDTVHLVGHVRQHFFFRRQRGGDNGGHWILHTKRDLGDLDSLRRLLGQLPRAPRRSHPRLRLLRRHGELPHHQHERDNHICGNDRRGVFRHASDVGKWLDNCYLVQGYYHDSHVDGVVHFD